MNEAIFRVLEYALKQYAAIVKRPCGQFHTLTTYCLHSFPQEQLIKFEGRRIY